MGMLEQVSTGKIKNPYLALIHGVDGVGKTTWASEAPSPIFLEKENGSNFLDVARLPEPKTFNDVLLAIHELTIEKHEYKTLVVDSLDFIEPLVWEHVCRENGWKDIEAPGYGKGYVATLDAWRKMTAALTELRNRTHMHIILICHTMVKPFNDPNLPSAYDRYILKLQEKAAGLFREFVDSVLFASYEIYIKEGKGGQKTKAFGGENRVLYTERRAGFDGKSRLGIPFELPLSFEAFHEAAEKGEPDSLKAIKSAVEALSDGLAPELKKKVSDSCLAAGENVTMWKKIENRLRVIQGQQP